MEKKKYWPYEKKTYPSSYVKKGRTVEPDNLLTQTMERVEDFCARYYPKDTYRRIEGGDSLLTNCFFFIGNQCFSIQEINYALDHNVEIGELKRWKKEKARTQAIDGEYIPIDEWFMDTDEKIQKALSEMKTKQKKTKKSRMEKLKKLVP